MLKVRGLQVSHGAQLAVRGVDLDLAPGEVVALLGRNGSGRSSLARALMGLLPSRGQLSWQGRALQDLAAHERARLGLGLVPEGREVFPALSVAQNLLLGLKKDMTGRPEDLLAQAYAWFPALARRRHASAAVLSGGEQQMLSLARTLLGEPSLLIVDEPTEGLAPQVVEVVAQVLAERRAAGVGILLIEQRLTLVHRLADRVLLMGRGEIVFAGTPAQLSAHAQLRHEWLEL